MMRRNKITESKRTHISPFQRFRRSSIRAINNINTLLYVLALVASICCVVVLTVYIGFDHTAKEYAILHHTLHVVQMIFTVKIIYEWVFVTDGALRLNNRVVHLCFEIPVILSTIAVTHIIPTFQWLRVVNEVLNSHYFQYIALVSYSFVMLSIGAMKLVNKRINPSLLLSASFLVVIISGSLLLSLPKCNNMPLDYCDALFVSTSAVCITGLSSIDVATQFTPLGILVLAILIQIGALGLMTFTSFFALFFSGSSSIYSQMMLKDVIYSRSMSSIVPTLLYVLSVTLFIEAIGALMIWLSVSGTLGFTPEEDVIFACFHSLSSFCNAGFSTLEGGLSNPLLLKSNLSIYWITTILIICGAIGFPILVNFKDALLEKLHLGVMRRRLWKSGDNPLHIFDMNTKIVLLFFSVLFLVGAVMFYFLEGENTLKGMTVAEKITQSAFNSAVPRSAGFSSVNPSGFLNVTLVMVIFLMWVGGASQSTAGGIKVNALAAIYYNLKALLTGTSKVTAFHRTISIGSVRRANAVVALSIIALTLYCMLLFMFEPNFGARELVFEAVSALFTVGSSLGVTPLLSDKSLILLSTAMFLGRVGIISLLTGFFSTNHSEGVSYPSANIIIS